MNWRRCADIPVATSAPQIVRIGNYVYVGGGYREGLESSYIFGYSLSQDTWITLPHCPTFQPGLASLDKELVVIGGISHGKSTNIVYTFKEDTWKEILPPMPTPRSLLSTLSHEDRIIIAAGGVLRTESNGAMLRTDIVEIYIKDSQWYITKRLPIKVHSLSATTVNDKCYLLGGYGTIEESCTTLYTTLSSLFEHAEPADSLYSMPQMPITWKKLKGQHPLYFSSIMEVNESLTAMGGAHGNHAMNVCGTKFISTYDFKTDLWVECQDIQLPLAVFRLGLVKLGNNKVMAVGGEAKSRHFHAQVYIGEFEDSKETVRVHAEHIS